jgi:putative nucleotidyltransferase with HDIG domain
LVTLQRFYEQAVTRMPVELEGIGLQLYRRLLARFAEPTLLFDREATDQVRARAQAEVEPVEYRVLEGERVVAAYERVTAEDVERLRAYRAALAEMGLAGDGTNLGPRAGNLLFNLLLLVLFGLVLRYFRPEVYGSDRSMTLIWLLFLAVCGAGALIARTGAPVELIPVVFAALVIAALYDGVVALLAAFVLTALVVARPPLLGMSVLFLTLLGGGAAALGGRVIRRRAQTWSLAAVIASAYVLGAVSLALVLGNGPEWILETSFWGSVNAVGSALLAMGILPVAESFTGITTDQTLLELADMNRPILRRLSLEAPGTYAHSINVANLAEAAAREIGANSLLTRVGVYYHDIGKLRKPQYFVENQPRGSNPHDKLKPAMSATIVREHVEEGLELADEAGLPDVVKRFITEHHGTQRIGFFYERAKEMSPGSEPDADEYRYPGPRPRSKETAIVLLADSVESAVRALQEPTPERIRETVDRIVAAKLADRQLDRAPLTFREVSTIKEQFVKVLAGMYHHRIDYPSPDEGSEATGAPVAREAP